MVDKGRILTAEDLYHIHDPGHRHELVRGELRTLPFHGGQSGAISCALASQLNSFVYTRGLGMVIGGGTGYILGRNPDTVRVPFLAFIRNDRIPVGGLSDSFVSIVPNLVAYVLDADETPDYASEIVPDWLGAGAQLLWILFPSQRVIEVHCPTRPVAMLTAKDELDGADILPGFRMPVESVFD